MNRPTNTKLFCRQAIVQNDNVLDIDILAWFLGSKSIKFYKEEKEKENSNIQL